jgi:general secretion pathway protein E
MDGSEGFAPTIAPNHDRQTVRPAIPIHVVPRTLDQLVVEQGLAPAETLARARLVQSETGEPLDKVLTRLGLVSEEALTAAIARAMGLRIAGAGDYPAEPLASDRISPRFLRDARAVSIRSRPTP